MDDCTMNEVVSAPGGVAAICINGEASGVREGTTVAELLVERALAGRRVAVEVNGAIVPRSLHAATPLRAHDRVEIVVAVGGG